MSTYNGEKYLAKQIDSILQQTDIQVELLIRDDGSKDRTIDILKEYADKYENIMWYQGENLGPQRSFFDLLSNANCKYSYFAFADQDDFWLPEKLKRAIGMIQNLEKEKKGQPIVYGSKVIYAAEDLKRQEEFSFENAKKPTFGNALVENIFMGCTEVFNLALLELVQAHQPKCALWHDWWLYLSAACFGEAIYDDAAYILYRQHTSNQVGMQNSWKDRWQHRLKGLKKLKGSICGQAQEFIKSYGSEYEHFAEVCLVAEYKKGLNRFRLVRNTDIYRQQRMDNMVYHVLFLLGFL